jgi:hypothetical protein
MDGQGSEVRCYVRYLDGEGERELTATEGTGGFEFGYGGSGPHALAAAIVADVFDSGEHWFGPGGSVEVRARGLPRGAREG